MLGLPGLPLIESHGYSLHIVARGKWAPALLAGYPWPVHIQPTGLRAKVGQYRELRKQCRQIDPLFDQRENALVLPESFSSALEMRLAGLSDPEYFQTSGSVRLTLTTTPVDRELEARLPPAARDLVRAIRDIDRPSTGDLVEASGVSRPVVLRRLRELVDLGLIEWIGTSKRDPRAYWRIAQTRL